MEILTEKRPINGQKHYNQISYFILLAFTLIIFGCNSGSNSVSEGSFIGYSDKPSFDEQKAAQAIESLLSGEEWQDVLENPLLKKEQHDTILELVQAFYLSKEYLPQWNKSEPSEASRELLEKIATVHVVGLDSADFPVDKLFNRVESIYAEDTYDYQALAKAEIAITANYFLLARQLGKGRIEGGNHLANWHIVPDEVDKVGNLEFALEEGVEEALDHLNPDYRQYNLLVEKLGHYIGIAEQGGWDEINLKESLKPGDTSKAVVAIRKRIQAETSRGGELESRVYDQELQQEIKEFRYRYGLSTETFEIDQKVVAAMNVPVEERIEAIKLNLDRSRWLTEPMGDRYIIVNIPEYKMRVIENKEPVLEMKVIVGETVNKTPVFSDSLEYVEFGPYWNVPVSIASGEILPRALNNPNYLQSRHFEIVDNWGPNAQVIPAWEIDWKSVDVNNFPYRIRQTPGHWNSLGQVKFMFPNNKAIYLHDTPADHLFSKEERGFSHGCIRVEHPDRFADYLLPDYSASEVDRLIRNNENKIVPLEKKIPVYLVYFTTIVDNENRLRFLEDIYDMDKVQLKAL